MSKKTLVFIHGYSVTSFETYGELPLRIQNEATTRGDVLELEDLFLGRYISFSDEVVLNDVARALETAVQSQLKKGEDFIAITHSTGGPVVRTWWKLFYQDQNRPCPMSHLIMLAPANHGSALAQLGKSKLSRVKSWVEGLEPGQGILNWLELGSSQAWDLNLDWIQHGTEAMTETGVFPFVIIGQSIDRKLYDHINSYTGEDGSDGVVRIASADLNNAYLKLEQEQPAKVDVKYKAARLLISDYQQAPATPLRVIKNKSHSGDTMGIMRSVKRVADQDGAEELVQSIFECMKVASFVDWQALTKSFASATAANQKAFECEVDPSLFRERVYLHDRYSLLILRVSDHLGNAVTDFDLVLTGENDSPDLLPQDFFKDRQCNLAHRNTLSFYLNYDILKGCAERVSPAGQVQRPPQLGTSRIGFRIVPRPSSGFVRYLPCAISGGKEFFDQLLRPNSTTLVEIVLQRLISQENFRFEKQIGDEPLKLNYKDVKPGEEIA
jgi:hypothetical protein